MGGSRPEVGVPDSRESDGEQERGLPRLAVRTVVFLWGSRLAAAAAGFLTQIFLARALGLAGYGAFAAALALVNFLLPLAGYGVPAYWLRAFGKGPLEGTRSVRPGLTLLWASSAAVSGLAVLLALVLEMPEASRAPALVLAALVPSQAILAAAGAAFQIRASFVALALCATLPYGLRLIVAAGALATNATPLWIAGAYAAAAVVLGVVYLPAALGMRQLGARQGDLPRSPLPSTAASWTPAQMAGQIWPFAFSGFFYAAYFQGSVALLGLLSGPEAAGAYGAGLSVLSVGYLLPAVVFQQYLLPYVHRWREHDRERLVRTLDAGVEIMAAASLGFVGVIAGLGPVLLPRLFGAEFARAGPLLVALAPCLPIRFLSSAAETVLLAEDDMRRRVWCQGLAALLGACLLFLLAPRYGAWGALAAILASESCVLAGYAFVLRRRALGGRVVAIRLRWRGSVAVLLAGLVVAANLAAGHHHAVGAASAVLAVGVSLWLLLTGPALGRLQ